MEDEVDCEGPVHDSCRLEIILVREDEGLVPEIIRFEEDADATVLVDCVFDLEDVARELGVNDCLELETELT